METKTVRRTGVIGLGAMGLQMARHMVSKGFDVAGYDIDVDAMRRATSTAPQRAFPRRRSAITPKWSS